MCLTDVEDAVARVLLGNLGYCFDQDCVTDGDLFFLGVSALHAILGLNLTSTNESNKLTASDAGECLIRIRDDLLYNICVPPGHDLRYHTSSEELRQDARNRKHKVHGVVHGTITPRMFL
jgi:hypothetical protein